MDLQEMIQRYNIKLSFRNSKPTGNIQVWNSVNDDELEEIREHKSEIYRYLYDEWVEKQKIAAERKEKIDAIEGLKEIHECKNEWANWEYEFNRRMEDENLSSFIPAAPKVKLDELKKKYPRAAAYLKAEQFADSFNYEISAIGKKAIDRILNDEDYNVVLEDMKKEKQAFVNRHIRWD